LAKVSKRIVAKAFYKAAFREAALYFIYLHHDLFVCYKENIYFCPAFFESVFYRRREFRCFERHSAVKNGERKFECIGFPDCVRIGIFLRTTLILFFMQKQFNFESEKKRYEAPALAWTFVNVEAGFASSADPDGNTTSFGVGGDDLESEWE